MSSAHLILPVSALPEFGRAVCAPEFPTVDLDAVLAQCFEALQDLSQGAEHLDELAWQMGFGEVIFEHNTLDDDQKSRIYQVAAHFLTRTLQEMVLVNVYHGYLFPYVFQRRMDDESVLLSRQLR